MVLQLLSDLLDHRGVYRGHLLVKYLLQSLWALLLLHDGARLQLLGHVPQVHILKSQLLHLARQFLHHLVVGGLYDLHGAVLVALLLR